MRQATLRQRINKKYGRKLTAFRRDQNLRQKDIAELFGVAPQQIQKYEQGRNRLRLEYVELLCKKFKVPYDFFFKDSPKNQNPKKSEL